jgi:hypothetical protein
MGFAYWGKRDDIEQETIYDGRLAFSVDHKTRQYEMTGSAEMIPHYLGSPGGQVILKDFVRLDTSGATGFELKKQDQFYLLTMRLPDIQQYDITNRYRVFFIDHERLLPMRVILHQETLGKVQNLDYNITSIDINNPALAYDFSTERYPADYTVAKRIPNKRLYELVNQL